MKSKITRITLGKEMTLEKMAKVGASVMLLPMGDKIKFTSHGIKYTIKREREK